MLETSPNLTKKSGAVNGGSIFFDPKHLHVNHVNLIGRITKTPRFYETPNGRKVVQFTLATKEFYLNEKSESCQKNHWHRVIAWGKWVKVIEEFVQSGMEVALEGKLTSRFYYRDGEKQFITEVEVNDLIIL